MITVLHHSGEVIAADDDWLVVAAELRKFAERQRDWELVDRLVADPAMVVLHLNTIYSRHGRQKEVAYLLVRDEGTRLVGTCAHCGEMDEVTTLRGTETCDGCLEHNTGAALPPKKLPLWLRPA